MDLVKMMVVSVVFLPVMCGDPCRDIKPGNSFFFPDTGLASGFDTGEGGAQVLSILSICSASEGKWWIEIEALGDGLVAVLLPNYNDGVVRWETEFHDLPETYNDLWPPVITFRLELNIVPMWSAWEQNVTTAVPCVDGNPGVTWVLEVLSLTDGSMDCVVWGDDPQNYLKRPVFSHCVEWEAR